MAHAIAADLSQGHPARAVEWVIAEGLEVYADEGLLGIVMENLLQNAWKFTRGRTPARIEVGATRIEDDVAYFVKDNGAGFDMTYAEKLFRPFQRLHTPAEFEGTGIGLALVLRIVHRHNGRVWAEGQPQAGACFYFILHGP